jgi:5-dehydro-2-deoxygluconokinase
VLTELYDLGIKPDWWKLEPQSSQDAWKNIGAVIDRNDPHCRGIVLLGLEAPEAELAKAFTLTEGQSHVKGFAIGRTIFNDVVKDWLAGKTKDDDATAAMAERFGKLVQLWKRTHS